MSDDAKEISSGLGEIFQQSSEARERGKIAFENIDIDVCMLCGAEGADKRNLYISMFYAVDEVVPELLDVRGVMKGDGTPLFKGYYLRFCKKCRADLLGYLKQWRDDRVGHRGSPMDHDGNPIEDSEYGKIYVRVNGVSVAMTEDEYREYKKGVIR